MLAERANTLCKASCSGIRSATSPYSNASFLQCAGADAQRDQKPHKPFFEAGAVGAPACATTSSNCSISTSRLGGASVAKVGEAAVLRPALTARSSNGMGAA